MIRLPSGRPAGPGGGGPLALPTRKPRRGLWAKAETAIIVGPSALELLTILSIVSSAEFAWHSATVAALLLRRRWPVLVLLVTLPVAFNGYLLLAPMAALYQVARQVPGPRTVALCALLLCAAGVAPWLPSDEEPFSYEDALFGLLSAVMLSAGPVAVGRLVRTRAELSERIAELARSQERERQLLADRAVAEERSRLAREMHDMVSHQVSMISMQAGALQVSSAEPQSQEIGLKIHELSVVTLNELRHLVGVLRTARERPGLAELPALVGASGLDAELRGADARERGEGEGRWPDEVSEAAYRTVQEALTNVRKYAPGSPVVVSLSAAGAGPGASGGVVAGRRALVVEVRNALPARPTAPQPPGGGYGLVGLRERAELLGGSLTAGATQEGEFLLRAVLPEGASDRYPPPPREEARGEETTTAPAEGAKGTDLGDDRPLRA